MTMRVTCGFLNRASRSANALAVEPGRWGMLTSAMAVATAATTTMNTKVDRHEKTPESHVPTGTP